MLLNICVKSKYIFVKIILFSLLWFKMIWKFKRTAFIIFFCLISMLITVHCFCVWNTWWIFFKILWFSLIQDPLKVFCNIMNVFTSRLISWMHPCGDPIVWTVVYIQSWSNQCIMHELGKESEVFGQESFGRMKPTGLPYLRSSLHT